MSAKGVRGVPAPDVDSFCTLVLGNCPKVRSFGVLF
jgi:hypothetical protein